jgi:ABC-type multidrug transport system permease subunit
MYYSSPRKEADRITLRIGYAVPILILAAADIGLLIFIISSFQGLSETGRASLLLLVFALLTALTIISIVRYISWIRDKRI